MSENMWTAKVIQKATKCLSRSTTIIEALDSMSEVGIDTTRSGLRHAFLKWVGKNPSEFLGGGLYISSKRTPKDTSKFDALIKAARKTPSMVALCDALDMAPGKVKALIAEAQASGIALKLGAGSIGLGQSQDYSDYRNICDIVPPTVGGVQKVGVISDLHAGSKYFLRAQIKDFIHRAYSEGVREILVPGDLLDGCYKHGQFELTHSGVEDQTQDLFETLPALQGLTYHAITGNHDETFVKPTGLNIGSYIAGHFKERGRHDLKFYGDRGAFVKIRGAVVHMWHPMGSAAYALSYKLQKMAEKYSSGEKPSILLVGHYHQHCSLYVRGIHTICCPTFQGGGSAFSKALGGAPAIGGLILDWHLTEDGTIRDFGLHCVSYFEREQPKEVWLDQ